jgi:hypothetical protein
LISNKVSIDCFGLHKWKHLVPTFFF